MSAFGDEAVVPQTSKREVANARSLRLSAGWSTTWDRIRKSPISRELFWGRWHRRGMMIDNEPVLTALDVSEAVACGQALGLSVLDIGKGVIAGIDRGTAIHANQLLAERDLEAGKDLEGRHEIIPQRR